MKALQNVIPTEELSGMAVGVFPRITCALDGLNLDQDKNLGKRIQLGVISWNYLWMVVTGEQDNPEANKLIRSSYDGANLKDGEGSVAGYVDYLKNTRGFVGATVKKYVEMYGHLVSSSAMGPVPLDEQQLVQVSVAPQSVGQFGRYMLESGLRKAQGLHDSHVLYLEQQSRQNGPKRFAYLTFANK